MTTYFQSKTSYIIVFQSCLL